MGTDARRRRATDDRALPVPRQSKPHPVPASRRRGRRRARTARAVAGFWSGSGRLIAEHRHRRRAGDLKVSDRSRRGLDWTNFFMADVQMSFGSFSGLLPRRLGMVEAGRRAGA